MPARVVMAVISFEPLEGDELPTDDEARALVAGALDPCALGELSDCSAGVTIAAPDVTARVLAQHPELVELLEEEDSW